jgi:hypothetical protein
MYDDVGSKNPSIVLAAPRCILQSCEQLLRTQPTHTSMETSLHSCTACTALTCLHCVTLPTSAHYTHIHDFHGSICNTQAVQVIPPVLSDAYVMKHHRQACTTCTCPTSLLPVAVVVPASPSGSPSHTHLRLRREGPCAQSFFLSFSHPSSPAAGYTAGSAASTPCSDSPPHA